MFAFQNTFKISNFMREILQKVDVAISISPEEASFRQRTTPSSCSIWVVPNGVDTEYYSPSGRELGKRRNRILFCGSMDVTMNIDAVSRFAYGMFPRVRKRVSNAEFWVVGRNPSRNVLRLARRDGVFVTGSVDDVRPYYDEARVFVAPFRYGAGSKLKLLEALSMSLPIVSTSVGSVGIEAVPGQHFMLRNDEQEFADAVVEMMLSNERAERLARSGRRLVEERYSWGSVLEPIVGMLGEKLAVTE